MEILIQLETYLYTGMAAMVFLAITTAWIFHTHESFPTK